MVKNINKDEKRYVPAKNYLIVALMTILVIGLAIFFRNWYISYQDYEKDIPVLKNVISEINYNDIHDYIRDNGNVVIYMSVADDADSRALEKEFKKVIKKRHLKEKIVYFNITDIEDKKFLIEEINTLYAADKKLTASPAIMLFVDGKIFDLRSRTVSGILTIEDIEDFLDEHEIKGE